MSEQSDSGDRWLAWLVGAAVIVVLYLTAPAIGYARDEGFYFVAATEYGRWLELLVDHPDQALTRHAIDAEFRINAEHPSLMKLLFGLSHRLLHEWLGVIPQPGPAFRLPGMLMSGLTTGLIVLWGSRSVSRWAGLVAGLLFITMPRVFHHAHLACFDLPVVATTLLTVYAYFIAKATRRLSWVLAVGLCYGLALDTKHNAWSLPGMLLVHLLLTEGRSLLAATREERWRAFSPLLSMLLIGPLVLLLLWPWLWFDTFDRLRYWVEFHLRHDYYNMEFLGRTYHRPPMPRSYAWVMTLGTVPFTTLLLAGIGLYLSLRHAWRSGQAWRRVGPVATWQRENSDAVGNTASGPVSIPDARSTLAPAPWDARRTTDALWFLGLLAGYAPWWFTTTPIFGGTKHWLTAYPFLCLFAARGFGIFTARLREQFGSLRRRPWMWRGLCTATTLLWLAAPLVMTVDSLPFGLSAYTPILGGAPGAATLGMNRTFWGYTSIEMAEEMVELLPQGGRVFVHDTAMASWDMHRRDGTFAPSLVPTLHLPDSDIALYHYEPHMARVEYQIWEAYGTTSPEVVTTFDGVPVLWLYARPATAHYRGAPR